MAGLLDKNIRYYGIELAIHNPAANVIESDFARNEIKFRNNSFDILVAAGVFESMGKFQNKKLRLPDRGKSMLMREPLGKPEELNHV